MLASMVSIASRVKGHALLVSLDGTQGWKRYWGKVGREIYRQLWDQKESSPSILHTSSLELQSFKLVIGTDCYTGKGGRETSGAKPCRNALRLTLKE